MRIKREKIGIGGMSRLRYTLNVRTGSGGAVGVCVGFWQVSGVIASSTITYPRSANRQV